MSTGTEYLRCTPNMKNEKYRPCSRFILDKKENIFEYIYQSTCKMKHNIAIYILFQFTWGRILNHP